LANRLLCGICFNTDQAKLIFMKYFPAIVLLSLATLAAMPACAQRDAYTSSARAAYQTPDINTELNIKKNTRKSKKVHSRKARKIKIKDSKSARIRRSSLHF
jgi:hypothetical protein